jgi:hypothetical protein
VNRAGRHSDAYLAAAFDVFARGMARLRRRVARLELPGDLADDYSRLRRAMRALQRDLADIATAARRHSPAAARRATIRLLEDAAELRSARKAVVRRLG